MEDEIQETEPISPEAETMPAPVSEPSSAEPDVTHRLAADFIRLSEELPELHSPDQLPPEVLRTAAEESIPLLDAFLRYRWQEEKRARAEERRRREAAERSAGSLGQALEETHPEQDAFLRSFRSALR